MDEAEIQIHAVQFRPDGVVEITYAEAWDQSEFIQVVKVLMLDPKHSGRQIASLISDIADTIDLAMVRLRNDPETLPTSLRGN